MATTEIYADSRGRGTCRGCGAPIECVENVVTGRRMPMDDGTVVALRTRHGDGGRLVEEIDLAGNHWATCPDAVRFRS